MAWPSVKGLGRHSKIEPYIWCLNFLSEDLVIIPDKGALIRAEAAGRLVSQDELDERALYEALQCVVRG